VDTSVIINGHFTEQIESGSIRNTEIIIPQAVIDELHSQASRKQNKGSVGLENLAHLHEIAGGYGLTLTQGGSHLTSEEIELAEHGRIDAIIVDQARQNKAALCTSDRLQDTAARAQGTGTIFLHDTKRQGELEFLKFFDDSTMSVHLKEDQPPFAKKGRPGSFELVAIADEPLRRGYIEKISAQILDAVNSSEHGTVEIAKDGAVVVQYQDYRIAITYPAFSEAFEITIVHPIVRMSLDDYDISDKMMERFRDKAEGIIIAGPPGSGKSTLASSLGNFYHGLSRIVKTFESPRDLQVEPGITQYSKLEESFENTADILLLVRPDYTIFDEVRRREDFETFADLRMTGVGMVGVVHANTPIDAIQRFIGKIELGMIPSVLDTVVFVKDGQIKAIYDLELQVKVPSGMTESDLARPVIVVRDYTANVPVYEIYTFGEENIIMPVSSKDGGMDSGVYRLAADKILDVFKRYDRRATVEFVSESRVKVTVSRRHRASIIGRGGSHIEQLQKMLGVSLDIVTRDESGRDEDSKYDVRSGYDAEPAAVYDDGKTDARTDYPESHNGKPGTEIPFQLSKNRNIISIDVGRQYQSRTVEIKSRNHNGGEPVVTCWVNKRGTIKISTRAKGGRAILDMPDPEDELAVVVVD